MGLREDMDRALADLVSEVTRNTKVDDSAAALIEGFAAAVEKSKNDPKAIQAAVDTFRASSDKLSAAVVAGTSADEGTGNGDSGNGDGGIGGPEGIRR